MTDYFRLESFKATFLRYAGVTEPTFDPSLPLVLEYRYAVPRGGAVEPNPAGQDLPCLLSIFPDIFVASSCECDPTQQTLATASPYVPFRLFPHFRYTVVSWRWARRGQKKMFIAYTHWYGQESCLGSSPRNFHWKPTRKHPHSGYVHVLNPESERERETELPV